MDALKLGSDSGCGLFHEGERSTIPSRQTASANKARPFRACFTRTANCPYATGPSWRCPSPGRPERSERLGPSGGRISERLDVPVPTGPHACSTRYRRFALPRPAAGTTLGLLRQRPQARSPHGATPLGLLGNPPPVGLENHFGKSRVADGFAPRRSGVRISPDRFHGIVRTEQTIPSDASGRPLWRPSILARAKPSLQRGTSLPRCAHSNSGGHLGPTTSLDNGNRV